jgi:hypothetical protein
MSFAPSTILRHAYALTASAYAILGLIQFGYAFSLNGDSANGGALFGASAANDTFQQALQAYMIYRLVIGIAILPAHLAMLYPMRFSSAVANANTRALGGGDMQTGVTLYYALMNYGCNILLPLVTVWGGLVLGYGWQLARLDTGYKIIELISLSLLTVVWLARLLGLALGKTRSWFYLAWSQPPLATA